MSQSNPPKRQLSDARTVGLIAALGGFVAFSLRSFLS